MPKLGQQSLNGMSREDENVILVIAKVRGGTMKVRG